MLFVWTPAKLVENPLFPQIAHVQSVIQQDFRLTTSLYPASQRNHTPQEVYNFGVDRVSFFPLPMTSFFYSTTVGI
jgi:hypothetical protein